MVDQVELSDLETFADQIGRAAPLRLNDCGTSLQVVIYRTAQEAELARLTQKRATAYNQGSTILQSAVWHPDEDDGNGAEVSRLNGLIEGWDARISILKQNIDAATARLPGMVEAETNLPLYGLIALRDQLDRAIDGPIPPERMLHWFEWQQELIRQRAIVQEKIRAGRGERSMGEFIIDAAWQGRLKG